MAIASLVLLSQLGTPQLSAQSTAPIETVTSTPATGDVAAPEPEVQSIQPEPEQAAGYEIRRPDAEATPGDTPKSTAATKVQSDSPTLVDAGSSPGMPRLADGMASSQSALNAVMLTDADVAPSAIHAGDALTYTFSYTNVTGSAQNNVIALVTWTRMNAVETAAEWERNQMQFCANSCQPINVTGPIVTKGATSANGNDVQYQIASLQAGQSGRFSVVLKVRRNQYPRTGVALNRPAASVQMFADNNLNAKLAEDTTNALIIGPVLVLNKIVTPSTLQRVRIEEPMAFQIGIGNTTAPGDIIDNRARADAETATNLVFTDRFPVGADYIPSNDDPPGVTRNVDTANRIISWTVASLAPREMLTVTARFQKNQDPTGCEGIANIAYHVSANEYPLNYSGVRYKEPENPARVAVNVVPLVKVADMVLADPTITFGDETTASVVVHNYHSQAIAGAQLEFNPHNKIAYVPGSGSPAPSSAPAVATLGGQVLWNFNIGAGSSMTPTVMTFTFRLRGGFVESINDQALARVLLPSGLSTTCMGTYGRYITVSPRLQVSITKLPWTQTYQIESARPYTYEIEVRNRSKNMAVYSATVTATLPSNANFPANFSYIQNSASVGGVPQEPTHILSGNGGSIAWRNALTVPANSTLKIAFSLLPAGYEFVEYCTSALTSSAIDPEARPFLNVCLKINPPIEMSKVPEQYYVVDPSTEAGREVTFSLRITNTGQLTYSVALLDLTRNNWTFARQVESNNGTPTVRVNGIIEWPLQPLGPGQSLYSRVVLRVPPGCPLGEYTNELGFRFTAADNSVYDVVRVPALTVKVPCITEMEIGKSADRLNIGLFDQVVYAINLTNKSSGQMINSIVVTDILPIGFTYESLDPNTSAQIGAPTFSTYNDRQVIRWTVQNLPAAQSRRIVFVARSGNVVGQFDNWVWGTSPERVVAKCLAAYGGQCINVDMGNGPVSLMAHRVNVEPLATLEPTLNTDACVLNGEPLTYTLAMVSTNDRDYSNTTVAITVPLGLRVINASTSPSSGVTTVPAVANDAQGNTVIRWTGITLPRKPYNQSNAQVVFYVNLRRDNMPGDLTIVSSASSPVGGILKKDTAQDPVARGCALPTGVYAYKAASMNVVRSGDVLIFELGVVNSTTQPVNLTVTDNLLPNFVYSATISGPAPQINGTSLTWTGVSVPALSGSTAGKWLVRIRVRLAQSTIIQDFANQTSVSNASSAIDTSLATTLVRFEGVPPTPTPTPTATAGSIVATPANTPQPSATVSLPTATPAATATPQQPYQPPSSPSPTPIPSATPPAVVTLAPTLNPTALAAQRFKAYIPLARR